MLSETDSGAAPAVRKRVGSGILARRRREEEGPLLRPYVDGVRAPHAAELKSRKSVSLLPVETGGEGTHVIVLLRNLEGSHDFRLHDQGAEETLRLVPQDVTMPCPRLCAGTRSNEAGRERARIESEQWKRWEQHEVANQSAELQR